jgi:hypothetical protein
MTTPFRCVGVAILYFGWLWHDRRAADRSEDGLLSRSAKDSSRTVETHATQPAAIETVMQKPHSLRTVYTPPASAAVGCTKQ